MSPRGSAGLISALFHGFGQCFDPSLLSSNIEIAFEQRLRPSNMPFLAVISSAPPGQRLRL
jgi:hypothetical protein